MVKVKEITITEETKLLIWEILNNINSLEFLNAKEKISEIKINLDEFSAENDKDLDREYILSLYINLLEQYRNFWELIYNSQLNQSWHKLQDCLSLLRCIKKFSTITIGFFERQLTEIEKAYPYSVFASPTFLVDYYECSICEINIDSEQCPHIKGELYQGVIAQGIAKGVTPHSISFVPNPKDKHCLVLPPDGKGELTDFTLGLSRWLKDKTVAILDFDSVKLSSIEQDDVQESKSAHLLFVERKWPQDFNI